MKDQTPTNKKLRALPSEKIYDIHGGCIEGIKRYAKGKDVIIAGQEYFYNTYRQITENETVYTPLDKKEYFKVLSLLFKKIAATVSKTCEELPLPKGLGSLTVFEYQQPLYPSHWRDVLRVDCKSKNVINTGGKNYRCIRLGLLPAKNNPIPNTWNWVKKNTRNLDNTFFKELYKHKYEQHDLIKVKVRDENNHLA